MTPYSSLNYFLVVLLILVPMMWAGARGRADGRWIVGATVLMLLVQYRTPIAVARHVHPPELMALLLFGGYQWGLLRLTLAGRIRGGSRWVIPLALVPLVVSRFVPEIASGSQFGFAGISYVTFRALDVLWAVTDGVLAEVGLLDFAIFLFFFPTISSGPIDRFRRFKAEWRQQRTAAKFWQDFDAGLHQVMMGLLYKFVLATILERHFLGTFKAMPGFTGAAGYAYVYSAYLFFDFAGYSLFAIGVSRWFGVSSPANFNLPWAARNIRDFWNRWHMSLSFWFRDHVYTRFLLAAAKGRWFRRRETAGKLGYFVSFGLMGLWHGLTWYYILYGFYHAVLFYIFDAFSRWRKSGPDRLSGRHWKWAAHLLTIHAVVAGFWLFSGQGWQQKPVETAPRELSREAGNETDK